MIKGHAISGNRRISHDAGGRHQAALLAARCILATFLLLDQARQARRPWLVWFQRDSNRSEHPTPLLPTNLHESLGNGNKLSKSSHGKACDHCSDRPTVTEDVANSQGKRPAASMTWEAPSLVASSARSGPGK